MRASWARVTIAVLVCVLLAGREGPDGIRAQAPSSSSSASASRALQRGLTLMETRGNCTAALSSLDVAARSQEAAVAARALLAQGQCLERLGRPAEARAAYQALVTRFSAHPYARQARRRLRVVAPPTGSQSAPGALTLRKLDIPDLVPTGTLSADGRYVAFHDSNGIPFRRDLLTGRAERLTLGGGDVDGTRAWALLLSPDAQRVAYTWDDGRQRGELRIAPALGGGAARTLVAAGALQAIRPVAWTADGRSIVVITTDAAYRLALQIVDVQAQRMDMLIDLGLVEPFFVSLARDGRRLLFDHSSAPGPRDIVLLDLVTRRTTPVVSHGADDAMPVFLPGGRAFLFASNRLGPLSLWRQVLEGGEPRGEPTLVRRDIGRIWPMGVSSSGTFVHGLQTGMIDVFTARLGDDGRIVEQAVPVSSTFAGYNQAPDWSRDGRFLVYAATRGAGLMGVGTRALVIREHATGQERLLFPNMLFLNAPRWSNDGSRILVKGRSASSNRWGEFIVDAHSGAVTSALTADTLGEENELGPHQWVPGREGFVIGRHGKGIVEVDLTTGGETTLVPLDANVDVTAGRGCAYAPDGRTLAWSVRERRTGQPPQAVLRVREPDGTIRELLRAAAPDWLMLMDWAPDGRSVYVVRQTAARPGAAPARTELWRVPMDGSPPIATGLTAPSLRGVSIHPDGRTVAYVTGLPTWEIWAMEGIR